MPGNKIGGLKAAATNRRKYGDDFYKNIGKKGGANGHTGGFAANIEIARLAGMKGGKISRRKSKFDKELRASLPVIKKFLAEKESVRSVKDLSRELNIPYVSLAHYIRKINK